jgi:hypothetical protein
MKGAFSMYLPLLKVGMLGCKAIDAAPTYRAALVGDQFRVF